MGEKFFVWLLRTVTFSLAVVGCLISSPSGQAQAAPEEVPYCTLARNPKAYDGKTIRVRGTLGVAFEDFSLWAKDCKADQSIWLAFGGDVPTPVTSMVNDRSREPGSELTLNGMKYAIKKSEALRRLNALIAMRRKKSRDSDEALYEVTATLTGVFLAGEPRKGSDGITRFLGYGHLGCCSLFIITEVSDVVSVPQANLTVRGTVLGPDNKPLQGIAVINDLASGVPSGRQQTTTDATGAFILSDAGQLLRIEDPRFRPYAAAVRPGGAPLRIRLQNSGPTDWTIPPCQSTGNTVARVGFSILFALLPGWKSEPFDDDIMHALFVYPPGGSAEKAQLVISREADPRRPVGFLEASYIEESWIKDKSGSAIGVDFRARFPREGNHRTVKFFDGEAASFGDVSKGETANIDRMIDSACIANR